MLLLVQGKENERISECMRCRLVARDEEQEDVPWRMVALPHGQREGRTNERTDERAVGKLRGAIELSFVRVEQAAKQVIPLLLYLRRSTRLDHLRQIFLHEYSRL